MNTIRRWLGEQLCFWGYHQARGPTGLSGRTLSFPQTRGSVKLKYLWCHRCERWYPGSLPIPETRSFP